MNTAILTDSKLKIIRVLAIVDALQDGLIKAVRATPESPLEIKYREARVDALQSSLNDARIALRKARREAPKN
jgi:hypothetical protein